jgi:hypothetical protein
VHETTSEYTDDILDFFEREGAVVPILPAEHPAVHGATSAHDRELHAPASAASADDKQLRAGNAMSADVQQPTRHKRKTLQT